MAIIDTTEAPSSELHGLYRDVLRDPSGRVIWERDWRPNAIVVSCRQLLASFMAGPASLGIQGLRVGKGNDSWDTTGNPPATPTQPALVDQHSFLVPRTALQIDFLDGATETTTPTNRLQVVATIGPGMPPWPDADHASGNLREFGLVGSMNGKEALINYVTHPVIIKDPLSTLTRTIWLVF
jgi:hypothetical protein